MSNLDRSFWTGLSVRVPDPSTIVQVGALCLREKNGAQEVLLVKSSRGRWIVPKGWPMDGHTDAETAKVEAWEEAGVDKARITKAPIGGYMTEKRYDDGRRVPCQVSVYRMDVKSMVDSYPEAAFRKRKWMSLAKARRKVNDTGLQALLKAIT